jgi:hypothetical protein
MQRILIVFAGLAAALYFLQDALVSRHARSVAVGAFAVGRGNSNSKS